MKRVLCLVCVLALALSTAGCLRNSPGPSLASAEEEEVTRDPNEPPVTWSFIRSPQTGKCYEVATMRANEPYLGYGYMGMAEVDCEEIQ